LPWPESPNLARTGAAAHTTLTTRIRSPFRVWWGLRLGAEAAGHSGSGGRRLGFFRLSRMGAEYPFWPVVSPRVLLDRASIGATGMVTLSRGFLAALPLVALSHALRFTRVCLRYHWNRLSDRRWFAGAKAFGRCFRGAPASSAVLPSLHN